MVIRDPPSIQQIQNVQDGKLKIPPPSGNTFDSNIQIVKAQILNRRVDTDRQVDKKT